MKAINDILKGFPYEILTTLCLQYGFKEIPQKPATPYSSQAKYRSDLKNYWLNLQKSFKQQDLIDLIITYFKDSKFFPKLLKKLKDSQSNALFLKILIDNDGEICLSKIIQLVKQSYSEATIKKTYQNLLCKYTIAHQKCAPLIFKDIPTIGGVSIYLEPMIYLPEEFIDFADWFIKRHIKILKPIKIEKKARIASHVISIEELILLNCELDRLKRCSRKLGLPATGNKKKIIKLYFTQSKIPSSQVLNILFSLQELKQICNLLNLKTSGKKIDLITNISNILPIRQKGGHSNINLRPDRLG